MFDPDQIRAAVAFFYRPEDVFECRVIDAETREYRRPHMVSGYYTGDDADALIASLAGIGSYSGVYITINPVNPALLGRANRRLKQAQKGLSTSDTDIARRRWLPIDIDPVRPAGICATDAEVALADAAVAIYARLPGPVVVDSGSGRHAYYPIDLPTDDDAVARYLAHLAAEHAVAGVHVDTCVHNPSRIMRLPGTWNCKGDATEDRPHRPCRFIADNPTRGETCIIDAPALPTPPQTARRAPVATDRPGDAFNATADIAAILTPHGWQMVAESGGQQYWRRPGKTVGNHSATFDGEHFYVFSSAAPPFTANESYTPFAVEALLNHGGNFAATAASVAAPAPPPPNLGFPISELNAARRKTPAPRGPADPGPTPSAMFDVPGFIGNLTEHTLATAPYPNRPLAFAAALAMQAFLASRRVALNGTRPPLYIAALAPSATGKEHPTRVNRTILEALELMDHHGSTIASGPALEDWMQLRGAMLIQNDEFDRLVHQIAAESNSTFTGLGVSKVILEMFTRNRYDTRMKARRDGSLDSKQTICEPGLTIMATGVPSCVWERVDTFSLANGLIARFLLFEAAELPRRNRGANVDQLPPDNVMAIAAWWAAQRGNVESGQTMPDIRQLDFSMAAREYDFAQCDATDDRRRNMRDERHRAIIGRTGEKAAKLALLYELSANPLAAMVDIEAVKWGWAMSSHQTERMLYMAETSAAESPFDALCQRVIKAIRDGGGSATRRDVCRATRARARELDEAIQSLMEQDRIRYAIIDSSGAGRPVTIYTE